MVEINGNRLTISEVAAAAKQRQPVTLSPKARKKIAEAHQWVQQIVQTGKPVYGINTGFGIFSNKHISPDEIEKLNRNLILSHAVGAGPDLSAEVVRAAILIRANTLAAGHSGVRPEIVETLLALLNQDLTPCIPSQGSLGSSGDLAPLSHLALVITTDENDHDSESGFAIFGGQRLTGKAAMQAAGLPRLVLGPKEGLAITNGATFSAALAALSVHRAENLLDTAEVALAMSLEALLGVSAAFDERLHHARRQPGQIAVAARVRELTQGSTLLDAAGRVQDAYSLRCAPQVQGPARDTLEFVRTTISQEINAATDNPLLFGPGEALSGGNFHGEVIAMVMDYLKIALSEVAAISERRIFQLTDGKMNGGLPPMLVASPDAAGLNSGVMMPQYTAASLVLENIHTSAPDSTLSLPTSGGQEDHNANAMTAARHAYQVSHNCSRVLAVELYSAARALDLRLKENPAHQMGVGVAEAHRRIRERVPFQPGDAWWNPEIDRVVEMVLEGRLAI